MNFVRSIHSLVRRTENVEVSKIGSHGPVGVIEAFFGEERSLVKRGVGGSIPPSDANCAGGRLVVGRGLISHGKVGFDFRIPLPNLYGDDMIHAIAFPWVVVEP